MFDSTLNHPKKTLSIHSVTKSVSVLTESGDNAQSGFQRNSDVGKSPKVSRRRNLHVFTPDELNSTFLSLAHTQKIKNSLQGTFLDTFSRTRPRPNLVLDQCDRGCPGNPSSSTLWPRNIGMRSTIMWGSMNPGDTLKVTSLNIEFKNNDDDDSPNFVPITNEENRKFEHF